MGKKSVDTAHKKARPKGCLGRFLVFLVVVEGLILAAGIAAFVYVNSVLDLVERPENVGTAVMEKLEHLGDKLFGEKDDGIINILLIGQDMREGADHKLADAMILCSVNRNTGTMTMCSLMRDMYVQLPDYAGHTGTKNRINAAYSLGYAWNGEAGGMEMLDKLILEQFGVEVDHNVEFSFESFVRVVDALGGVELELTAAEAAHLNKQNLQAVYTEGLNLLGGESALAFVRTRRSSAGDSDFFRTGRQRAVIAAVAEKLKQMDLTQLTSLITELLPMIYTDMTNKEILSLAVKLLPIAADLKLESQQIPADGTYENARVEISGYPAAVLVPDLEKNRQILMDICEG